MEYPKKSTVRCVRITDTGLGYLSTMSSLRSLYLRWCCQVQDFGLQHLFGMRSLRLLSLAGMIYVSPLTTPKSPTILNL
ncbi:hypothetical protein ILYODFUR_034045 [Ilyodon furcidens]|uniref:Uncharacterized protein n=1 Tax=Ilyodon furcidens TaxID=33524 RepID=A0ABV0V9B3_9TELE